MASNRAPNDLQVQFRTQSRYRPVLEAVQARYPEATSHHLAARLILQRVLDAAHFTGTDPLPDPAFAPDEQSSAAIIKLENALTRIVEQVEDLEFDGLKSEVDSTAEKVATLIEQSAEQAKLLAATVDLSVRNSALAEAQFQLAHQTYRLAKTLLLNLPRDDDEGLAARKAYIAKLEGEPASTQPDGPETAAWDESTSSTSMRAHGGETLLP